MKIKLGLSNSIRVGVLGVQNGAAAPATYSISGTVYDSDGTTAVSGATVALGAASTTSAANGTYSLTGLAAGTSGSMTCTKSGYSWTAITISAMSGNLTGQNYTNVWYAAGGSLNSCVIAYKPIGASSLANSYINLANPGTNNAAPPGSAPSFNAATGWTFDGSGNVLTTGWVPPNQSTRSGFARISGATADANNRFIFGSRNGANIFGVRNTSASSVATFQNGSGAYNHSANFTSGVLGVAGLDPYANGTDLGNIGAGTFDQGAVATYIGTCNGADQRLVGNVLAVVFYTVAHPAPAILSTAMANLA